MTHWPLPVSSTVKLVPETGIGFWCQLAWHMYQTSFCSNQCIYTYVYTLCLKNVSSFKLSVTLSNLNRFSKFCTAGKHMQFATKPYDITHLTLGALLHYMYNFTSNQYEERIAILNTEKIAKFVDEWSYRRLKMQFVCVFFHICRKFEFLVSHGGVPTCLRWVGYCTKGFVVNFVHCVATFFASCILSEPPAAPFRPAS